MTAAGGMNNAIPDDIRDDTHGGPGPIGLANTPWPAHPKVERIARRPVMQKGRIGLHPRRRAHRACPWLEQGATDATPEALGPRFRGGDAEEKIGLICLVRTIRADYPTPGGRISFSPSTSER